MVVKEGMVVVAAEAVLQAYQTVSHSIDI